MSTERRSDPELWDKVKDEITRSDKGGEPGQWSARKAQLAVQAYKRRGGGYEGERSDDNDLRTWTEEDWGTKSGGTSRETGERYLPEDARDELTDEEYRRTSQKKREDTRKGHQHSSQPDDIARKTAKNRDSGSSNGADDGPTKAELMDRAREADIAGRSGMSKDELSEALDRADGETVPAAASDLTKARLGCFAAGLGVAGHSRMSRDQLISAIAAVLDGAGANDLSKSVLSDIAATMEIRGRSKMSRADLAEAVRAAFG